MQGMMAMVCVISLTYSTEKTMMTTHTLSLSLP